MSSYCLRRPRNMNIILARKSILTMNLPDTSKFSHTSEEEIPGYVHAIVSLIARIAATEGISFVLLNWFSVKIGMSSNISF